MNRGLPESFNGESSAVCEGPSNRQIKQAAEGIALSVSTHGRTETITAERVLITTGRRPNTDDLGLAESGVDLLSNGGINVDDRMRTSKLGVYAAGDVTGRDQFGYMAAYGARIPAENALHGNSKRHHATAMPAIVFTDPQVASVGLTEAEAGAQGLKVTTSTL